MKKIRFLKYQGNKLKYITEINNYINLSKANTYVEPFLGSGAVFFNLEKEFEQYILNDLESNLILIYNTLKNSTYNDFSDMETICTEKYDIKNNKDDYYTFRDKVNNITDDYYRGLGLYFLYNSCINSMARFGPNGFNQSYGNRFYTMSKQEYDIVKSKLSRATIYNMDFFELNIPENSLLFIDPPYIERPTSYKTISKNFFSTLMNNIINTNNDILYTDIKHNFIQFDYITLRKNMKNTSPNRKSNNTNKEEVLYYKFNI